MASATFLGKIAVTGEKSPDTMGSVPILSQPFYGKSQWRLLTA